MEETVIYIITCIAFSFSFFLFQKYMMPKKNKAKNIKGKDLL